MTRLTRPSTGLATLEWLLVIAASGGFAAAMSVAFQNLIDGTTRTAQDPHTALTEAGTAAARISSGAAAAQVSLALPADEPTPGIRAQVKLEALQAQCEGLAAVYPDVVKRSEWTWTDIGIELPPPTDSEEPKLTAGRWVCRIEAQPQ